MFDTVWEIWGSYLLSNNLGTRALSSSLSLFLSLQQCTSPIYRKKNLPQVQTFLVFTLYLIPYGRDDCRGTDYVIHQDWWFLWNLPFLSICWNWAWLPSLLSKLSENFIFWDIKLDFRAGPSMQSFLFQLISLPANL